MRLHEMRRLLGMMPSGWSQQRTRRLQTSSHTKRVARRRSGAETWPTNQWRWLAGVVKQVLERVADTAVGLSQVDRFIELVRDDRPTLDVDFPGCRVIRDGDRIVVGPPRVRQTEPAPGSRMS